MIKRLELKSFRCFKQLDLSLKQFNVVVGESGSGKTALLESLFLLGGGSPEIYFRIRSWRGFSQKLNLSGTRENYQSIFSDIFYNFGHDDGAILSSQDSLTGSRRLEISYSDSRRSGLVDLNTPEPHAFTLSPINFKWTIEGTVHTTSLSFREGKFVFDGTAPFAPLSYYNPVNINAFENSSSFSALSRRFKTLSLTEAVATIYPGVKEITLELIGGEPTICVATTLAERLPIGDMSGGIAKFVTIALGIFANPKGTVVIDEIESGFYWRDMPKVWAALVKLCRDEQVQLVTSTHSYEFLKAASPVLVTNGIGRDSQLLRAEVDEDGQHVIKKIPAEAFEAATSRDFEVR